MNEINEKVIAVMEKYDKDYSRRAVQSNLDCWSENKGALVELLRKHPNWNEDAMAVIYEVSESREIDRYEVQRYRKSLQELAQTAIDDHEERDKFFQAMSLATDQYEKLLSNDRVAESIKSVSGISCSAGQKTSRVINRICQKYGLDKHPEYNARFAKLADSLNPLQVKRTALLSVHPCDFLEMSSDQNSWNSCHRLNGGEYQAGTLSYMNDATSMIFYTVDDDVKRDYYQVAKRTRQVFCYQDGVLLQSRLYPKTNDDCTRTIYRNLVQQTIAACLGIPNLWVVKKSHEEVAKYCETDCDALHYPDYDYDCYSATVSLSKLLDTEGQTVHIGNTAYCVNCGDSLCENNEIVCEDCNDFVYCRSCDCRVDRDDAHYIDGEWYCDDCCYYCDICEEYSTKETTRGYDANGNEVYVCEDCREDFFWCEECDELYHFDYCEEIDGHYYCKECISSEFYMCEECETYVHKDCAVVIDDCRYCEDCAEGIASEDEDEYATAQAV